MPAGSVQSIIKEGETFAYIDPLVIIMNYSQITAYFIMLGFWVYKMPKQPLIGKQEQIKAVDKVKALSFKLKHVGELCQQEEVGELKRPVQELSSNLDEFFYKQKKDCSIGTNLG